MTPDGDIIEPWYVIEYGDWVNCLVIDKDNQVILLQHYRQGIKEYVTEIVGGGIDVDETPEVAMARELQEEIGYQGGQLYSTGVSYVNPHNQNNRVHFFVAIDGAMTAATTKEVGADFIVEAVDLKEFVKNIRNPQYVARFQSLHLASIFCAFNFIRRAGADSSRLHEVDSIINS